MIETMPVQEPPGRPDIMGTRHVVAAGHYMAAQAGLQILEAGGNAVDAGVATGIATEVLESELTGFAGVAPIILYMAETRKIITISGLGTWPKAVSRQAFEERYGNDIPKGVHRTVVPAAPDAWITALELFGTMSFGEIAAAAIRFAREGFPMYPMMAELMAQAADSYALWPSSMAVFLPGGRPPKTGEVFIQADLASTLQYIADEEAVHAGKGREAGLKAARDAFYRGDIAATIVSFQRQHEGLLTTEDMAGFRVGIEPPVHTTFAGIDVFGCGPWCQGPMLLEELNLVEGMNLPGLGHNSAAYIHALAEAIKLAAADRHAYFGDPRFVDVPIEELLSKDYAKQRRKMFRSDRAWPEMPPAGDAGGGAWPGTKVTALSIGDTGFREGAYDTSYLCVVDKDGNAFSATPSDGSRFAPVVPGTGLVPSVRGKQSWMNGDHPSCIAPGKRPRLTPNPALAINPGKMVMPFGTPGSDVQTQAMLQVFLNMAVWGFAPQEAVEAPRFATYCFPSSDMPHDYVPGVLKIESRVSGTVGDELTALGHKVEWWPDRFWSAGSVCAIRKDLETGLLCAGADNRRTAYAVGW